MNVISPQALKPSMAAPATLPIIPALPFQVGSTTRSNSSITMRSERNIDVCSLFIVLEKERNLKLRELYRQRFDSSRPSLDVNSPSMQLQIQHEYNRALLPKLPPRYHCLKVSTGWLMLKLRKQRPTSQAFDELKALDKVTKDFLHDTVRVLQNQCEEDAIINGLCSGSTAMRSRNSITVTPPSSPLKRVTLTEAEPPLMALSKPPFDSIHEVDMTDEQIISLYEESESSGDAVVLDI